MSSKEYRSFLLDVGISFDEIAREEETKNPTFQKPLFPKSGIHFFHRQQFKKQPVKEGGVHFLSHKQQEHFKKQLEEEKKELTDALNLKHVVAEKPEQHIADEMDIATVHAEKEMQWDKQDRCHERLMLIEMAFKRLDEQTYGYCLETGESIELGRLRADPAVTLCLVAQSAREEKEILRYHSASSLPSLGSKGGSDSDEE